MDVGQLIEVLQRLPQDAQIIMHDAERASTSRIMGAGEIDGVAHLTTTPWNRTSTM